MYFSDAPIDNKTDDTLNRNKFAEMLSEKIIKHLEKVSKELNNHLIDQNNPMPSSLVIGLNGEWGSGKTSIINLINKSIDDKNIEPPIYFNPLIYSSSDHIIELFFEEIKDRIDNPGLLKKYLTPVKKKIDSYEKNYEASIGFKGTHLKMSASPTPKKSSEILEDSKKSIKDELIKELANIKLVIIMDDIDRLEDNEILDVFRLVKYTADFPNFVYLLSFDKKIVSTALNNLQLDNGEEYINKIINVSYDVPAITIGELKREYLYRFDKLFQDRTFLKKITDYVKRYSDAKHDGLEGEIKNLFDDFCKFRSDDFEEKFHTYLECHDCGHDSEYMKEIKKMFIKRISRSFHEEYTKCTEKKPKMNIREFAVDYQNNYNKFKDNKKENLKKIEECRCFVINNDYKSKSYNDTCNEEGNYEDFMEKKLKDSLNLLQIDETNLDSNVLNSVMKSFIEKYDKEFNKLLLGKKFEEEDIKDFLQNYEWDFKECFFKSVIDINCIDDFNSKLGKCLVEYRGNNDKESDINKKKYYDKKFRYYFVNRFVNEKQIDFFHDIGEIYSDAFENKLNRQIDNIVLFNSLHEQLLIRRERKILKKVFMDSKDQFNDKIDNLNEFSEKFKKCFEDKHNNKNNNYYIRYVNEFVRDFPKEDEWELSPEFIDEIKRKVITSKKDFIIEFLRKLEESGFDANFEEFYSPKYECNIHQINYLLAPTKDFGGSIVNEKNGIIYLFKNLRDIKRYFNTLSFNLEVVSDKVHFKDFLIITAIQLFKPDVFEEIKTHRRLFTGKYEFADMVDKDNDQEFKDFNTLIKIVAEDSNVKFLLRELFRKIDIMYRINELYEISTYKMTPELKFNRYNQKFNNNLNYFDKNCSISSDKHIRTYFKLGYDFS